MRVKIAIVLLAAVLPVAGRGMARADGGPPLCGGVDGNAIGCHDSSGGQNPGGGGGSSGTPTPGYWFIRVTGLSTPAACWQVLFQPDPTFVPTPTSWTRADAYAIARKDWGTLPECNSPAAVALQVWQDQKPVPAQHPSLQPDNTAVTGKRAYLLTNGGQTLQTTFPNPLGPSPTINATVQYDIDWGDGSVHTTTANPGVAWPGGSGEITHVYDLKGAMTITVNATWTGTWSDANGGGGALPAITVPYTVGVNVGEIQAVRNR